jgi:hypothetical protein
MGRGIRIKVPRLSPGRGLVCPSLSYIAGSKRKRAQAITKKPLVLLAEKGAFLPFDIAQKRIVLYGGDLTQIEQRLRQAIAATLVSRLPEAAQLFELNN